MGVRPNYLDYAKLIGMYIVVLGHYTFSMGISYSYGSVVWRLMFWITLFHMPFFFFVSGMLYKPRPFKEALVKNYQTLLKPYFLLAAIVVGIAAPIELVFGNITWKNIAGEVIGIAEGYDVIYYGMERWGGPLWFLYSLFIVKMICALILPPPPPLPIGLKKVCWDYELL